MATLNPNIILSGSNPNLMGNVAQGMQMRAFRDEMQQRNALADMYQQHGQGLVSGDPGALNALATVDPRAAMDFQTAHTQNQRAGAADSRAAEMHDARLQQIRAQAAQASRAEAAALSQAEREAAAERLESIYRGASTFAARGDQAGMDEYMRGLGMDPIPLAEFPVVSMTVLGNLDSLNESKEFYAEPEAPKPADEYQRYAQEEQQAGREPLSRIDYAQAKKGNGVSMMMPDGTRVQVGGSGDAKFTEGQAKDNVYSTRARGALEALEPVSDSLTSRLDHAAEAVPLGMARGAQSDDFQVAKQAGTEFLQAILRKDTGAAITPQETDSYGKVYLPQPGDGDQVLEAKRQARIRAINALESGMNASQMLARDRALVKSAQEADGGGQADAGEFGGAPREDLLNIDVDSLSDEEVNQLYEALKQ